MTNSIMLSKIENNLEIGLSTGKAAWGEPVYKINRSAKSSSWDWSGSLKYKYSDILVIKHQICQYLFSECTIKI